jgi:diguanylate cyclase (GGDEF)-like protein
MSDRIDILRWLRHDLDRTISRHTYLGSDAPTSEEIEAAKRTKERALLVIKMRWVLLSTFALFGLYASYVYKVGGPEELSMMHIAVPAAAFLLAIAYNGWYHYAHGWLSNYRRVNLAQLLLDLLFVTVIVHYSGGAVSWFWTMYFLLILQATFLSERIYDALIVGAASSLLYGGLLLAEFHDIVTPVPMPFENLALQQDFGYGTMKWLWLTLMFMVCAGLGAYMIREVQRQEERLRMTVIKDCLTGMYNRAYFQLRLNSETKRASRYGREFSLLLLDIDDFKEFNDRYGHHCGDMLLRGVGRVLRDCVRRSDTDPPYDLDIPCRIGGEEFAVMMPEASAEQGKTAAERLLREIEALDIEDMSATVSIGVAAFPDHGASADEILKAADDAMYQAKASGKNRVVASDAPRPSDERLPFHDRPAAESGEQLQEASAAMESSGAEETWISRDPART